MPRIGKVLFLIRSLNIGGSERQLVVLVRGLHARGYDVGVVVFYSAGPLEAALQAGGVPVHHLGKRSRWDLLTFGARLARLLRQARPDVVHGYLPEANLASLVARVVVRDVRVVWGVRASHTDWSQFDWLAKLLFTLGCRLARFAHLIIFNSRAGYEFHTRRGYPTDRSIVVPNGIDTDLFCPSPQARARMRAQWGVGVTEPLVGIAGRIDQRKGHSIFLSAAALVQRRRSDLRFVVVGDGPAHLKADLDRQARDLGVADRVIWAGVRSDMADAYNAMDVATSASVSEGFPNVVGEAMACGVPCVVTDVGDSRSIVADTGLCVPPNDATAMSGAWEALLGRSPEERTALGLAARRRIVEHYGTEALVERTVSVLRRPGFAMEPARVGLR